jgi:probable HAF family extracellular repeat protein
VKSRTLTCITAMTLFAALAIPVRLFGQAAAPDHHHHYQVIDLRTFGGPNSYVGTQPVLQILDNRSVVAGVADTAIPSPNCINPFSGTNAFSANDCLQTYGFKWQSGKLIKLPPLPGGTNSAAFYVNALGVVLGASDLGSLDPITGLPAQLAVLYSSGGMTPLGTLGGSSSGGSAVNDLGRAVGCASTGEPDPFFGVVQHAVVWQNGIPHDLKTLGGSISCAFYINNRGQIAGMSFTNSVANPTTQLPTIDPFLWENGTMKDLGTLGGVFGGVAGLNSGGQVAGNSDLEGDQATLGFLWSQGVLTPIPSLGGSFGFAFSLNDSGAVVGFGSLRGDQNGDAFVWKKGVITDLGRFGNDLCSVAQSINDPGQIVGVSTDCGEGERAALWENGEPTVDLNALIPLNSGLYLKEATYINDRGEITGYAILPNGDRHVILLVPCDQNHPAISGCDYSLVEGNATAASSTPATQRPAVIPNAAFRQQMMRLFGRRSMPWYRGLGSSPRD